MLVISKRNKIKLKNKQTNVKPNQTQQKPKQNKQKTPTHQKTPNQPVKQNTEKNPKLNPNKKPNPNPYACKGTDNPVNYFIEKCHLPLYKFPLADLDVQERFSQK